MANRYWVGGTADWNGTAGTKWATTSGGAGGASVPTTADDVFFSALSTGTCTIATGNTGAKSINCTGFTGTITGSAAITVAGSVTLSALMTYTHTGIVTLSGTGTLTTAGKTFSQTTVNGSGITVTLGDALNIASQTLTIVQGTFNTANFAVTAGSLSSSNSNVRTITLGSSTVTLSASVAVNFATSTNLTFNAGTSQLNISNTSPSFSGGGRAFYNVTFTNTSVGTRSMTGGSATNTFNNLTLTANGSGLTQLAISADQTVNGTFTCAGSSAIARGFVRSDTIGTTRTLTCAAVSADDCDFQDITIAGAAAPISPTRGGDCGGNSGITFPAAKTVYRVGTSTSWNNTSWSDTSGGSANTIYFPLAQDTAVINNDTTLTGTLALGNAYNIGTLDCSTRTIGITINHNVSQTRYGSYTLGSGVTVSGGATQIFSGRSTTVFTSAGKTITFAITVDPPSGTFRLGDAFTSTGSITHTRGTFDANNYNLTCRSFSSSNGNTRTITMGSGLWTLTTTGNVWVTATTTNLTFNKDTADILLADTTTNSRIFSGGSLSYNKLTIGGATGTSTLIIDGASSFTELASTKTVPHTVRLNTNLGTIGTWSITGTAGNVVTVNSNTAGTRRTFSLTNVTSGIDYLSVKDIGVNQANRFYVGVNSTDGGNNLNVIFTAAPTTQTLIPSLFTNTNTFYLTTITQTGPPQSLLPSLYSNVNTFYTPTVTQAGGVQTLTPSLYTNPNTFYAATVAASNTLAPALFTNTNVFYAATVTASNTLAPARYDNINVFYAPTVAASNTIAPALFTNTNTFYNPTVAASSTLTPARYDNDNEFYSPIVTIEGGPQTLLPPFYINTNIFYSPTVSQPGVQLVGGGGDEDSPRRKAKSTTRKKKGFANERAKLEASLLSQVEKSVEVLSDSNLAAAKKTAKTLDAYLNEKGTSDALQKQLDKLLTQLGIKSANDQNDDSLNADLIAAANEIQEFLDDEQEAIQILLLDQESDDALLLMAMGL